MTRASTGEPDANDSPEKAAGSIDSGHLLLVGAGPGLGLAVARRFAAGGYRVTLLARSADRLAELARNLDDTGAEINTVEADASRPEDLRASIAEVYRDQGAPGVVIYNAVLGAPDRLLSSTVAHLQEAYAVDVIGAIVVAQEAAPAMKAAGFGSDDRHRGRLRRSPDPGPRDRLARQGRPSVGRDDARRRSGPGRHSSRRRSRSPGRSRRGPPSIQRASPSATGRSSSWTTPGRRNSATPATRTRPPWSKA